MVDGKILISIVSVAIAVISGVIAIRKSYKDQDTNETSKMTTVIVKLENIGTGITEIKAEMNNIKSDIKDDHDRIIKLESSSKQLWHQVDEIKAKNGIAIHRDDE